MCGIAGIFAYHYAAPPVDREELRAIRDHMAARGPDGKGEWFSGDGRFGLGHRRLAIIDVPKTHVSEGLNGVHIVDWGAHDPDYEGPVTWPASLAADLVAACDLIVETAPGLASESDDVHRLLLEPLAARFARRPHFLSEDERRPGIGIAPAPALRPMRNQQTGICQRPAKLFRE